MSAGQRTRHAARRLGQWSEQIKAPLCKSKSEGGSQFGGYSLKRGHSRVLMVPIITFCTFSIYVRRKIGKEVGLRKKMPHLI